MIAPASPGYNLSLQGGPLRVATGRRLFPARPEGGAQVGPSLRELFLEVETISLKGSLDLVVESLCMDSRRSSPGALFFALPGEQTDGSFYIEEAIDRGAVAVVTEKPRQHHPRATFIQVANARAAMAAISRRFFGFVPGHPEVIGITGSHGKTTVSHLLKHLVDGQEQATGLLSSIHYDLGSRVVPSYRTTPEAIDLYGMIAQMAESGCRRAVLEISSPGITRKRVHGLGLDVAVFLNLGREHSPFHGGPEASFAAMSSLFTGAVAPVPGAAVVNLDDPHGRRLIQMIPEAVRLVRFGRSSHADVRASDVRHGEAGTSMRIEWPGGAARVRTRLFGDFNVGNILAAVAAAYACGLDLNLVLARLFSFAGAAGRLERVEDGQPFEVIVDSASSSEGIRHALGAMRRITSGRLLVVFGCSGGGSPAARMAQVEAVQEAADFAWATSDNPRNEPVGSIFDDMRHGVSDAQRLVFLEDRRRAISLALDTALPGDVVAVLGKGHEAFQYVGNAALPFDDRTVVRELLALAENPLHESHHA